MQVVDRPTYGELIIRPKTKNPRQEEDATDREQGGNETKTGLSNENETTRIDVLSSPYVDEVRIKVNAENNVYNNFI